MYHHSQPCGKSYPQQKLTARDTLYTVKGLASIVLVTGVTIVTVYSLVSAFTEPTALPPNENVPAPLNVGGGRQVKNGDLTVGNLKATSVTLGDDTRFAWPSGTGGAGGAACAWEGTKCDCKADGSTFADARVIIGATCASGQLTDIKVVNFSITSGGRSCDRVAPAGCTPSLYTRN